jgi:phosphoserine phosphatase
MEPFPWRLVTVDIDGTLTRGHGWRRIAERFDRVPEYERSNERFFAHEIGEDEHLGDLLELASGRPVAEVLEIVAGTPVLDGIREGVRELRSRGAAVALLTHNPGYVLEWYRTQFGFDDGEGTRGQEVVDGVLAHPRGIRADKVGGLERLLRRRGCPARATVHVGDGWSDAEVFPRVGGGIALNSHLPEVDRAADRVVRTTDFRTVASVIAELRPRP